MLNYIKEFFGVSKVEYKRTATVYVWLDTCKFLYRPHFMLQDKIFKGKCIGSIVGRIIVSKYVLLYGNPYQVSCSYVVYLLQCALLPCISLVCYVIYMLRCALLRCIHVALCTVYVVDYYV